MAAFAQELHYATRIFSKSRGFAAVAVFTLAVGIGANTSIFSVANALLLRPLPYSQPDRLVLVEGLRKDSGVNGPTLSWVRFSDLERRQKSFAALAAFCNESFNFSGRGDPAELTAARVSWNFFDILGVHPAVGRSFRPEEDRAGGDNVVLLTYQFWLRRFGSDEHIEGQHITLNSKDHTIIGVLPRGFRFALLGQNVDLIAPRVFDLNLLSPGQVQAGVGFLNFLGRLRPDVTMRQTQAEMDIIGAQYFRDNARAPDADPTIAIHAANLQDSMVSGVRTALLILLGAVCLVLLIACANVSNLMLSRAVRRKREIAVRTALGATRGTLMRQLLIESLLLSLVGGALGTLLSAWGTRVLASMAEGSLPLASEIHADPMVFAFTLVVSLLAGVLFGIAPALQVSRPDLNTILRSEGRGATSGRRRNLFRNLLVVSQVALSTLLMVGAGLLLRNFVQLTAAHPGFDSNHLLTMHVTLPPTRYPRGVQMIQFYSELVRQVKTLPGVETATISSALPLNPIRFSPSLVEGQPDIPLAARPLFNIQTLGPEFVQTMRLPLLAGRQFDEHDQGAPTVILVNQALAKMYWPGQSAIGKHILVGRIATPSEVVGVLGDMRNTELAADTHPEIYLPFAQLPWADMFLVVRSAADPHRLIEPIRQKVLSIDKDQPVTQVLSMEEVLDAGAAQPRFITMLLLGLSAIALLLAIVGIYGVIAYSVGERTQEIGIRMALGAERQAIARMVLRQGLVLALIGIAAGLVASLALTRVMTKLLYHVSATDPAIFGGCAVLFAAIAMLASYLPARRAMSVDPVVALRAG